jgi:acyl transferase domain-containing protein/NAD(P)-dependent dehydrogenase (short-subunit alcohol dehydrogenase family)
LSPAPSAQTPLAIIGIGCLFPGATGFVDFWASIVNKVDAIRDVPPTHWSAEDYLNPDPKAPDRVYAARGGFLDPIAFNPTAFGIPPSNLEATDSSQLLGLVVAQQALEDCGYQIASNGSPGRKTIDRSRISVILGVTGTLELVIPLGARLGHPIWRRALAEAGVEREVADDVMQRIADAYVPWQENSFPGLLGNVVAGRIANRFDLGGTNCVVDAACASSLSAIHLAAMELTTGRADLVLTGGVDTFNDIFMFTCFSKTPALSPTGNARPFDASADGTVLGEGLGMVVLKRLEDARRDGDHIYAVLRGVGSSSDGKGNAIYAPRKEGQIEALKTAYGVAGVSPDSIDLVEAHGTGTKVGDATEVSALTEVYRATGRHGTWCALGSIKSQFGHTKAAAGVAGLLKAVAALHSKVLPPTIKVSRPLDILDGDSPFYVNTEKRPWLPANGHPRRAAVSAFGFGGSNFHCVLEEADPSKKEIDWTGGVQILVFWGKDVEDLRKQAADWPAELEWPDLRLRADRSRREWQPGAPCRLLLVVQRETDVKELLARALSLVGENQGRAFSRPAEGIYFGAGPGKGHLAVLFPGQGAQYPGMLRDLNCHFPQAQEVLAETETTFSRKSISRLVDLVYPHPAFTPQRKTAQEEALRATDAAQPALGAVSLGAWRVLESFGVRADAFAGHSYGELVAMCAAGRLSEEELHRLSVLRGALMAEVGHTGGDAGTMLAVKARQEVITRVLREEGIDLVLANKNAPEQTVLSGTRAAIDRAAEAFVRRQVSAVRLSVAAAFHSPLVSAAREPFLAALADVPMPAGQVAVYANTTAAPYPESASAARELLGNQLARPVEWVKQIEALYAAGVRSFLEVGPGARLAGLVEAILAGRDAEALALDASSGQRGGFFDLAGCLAWLAARGRAINLSAWDPVPTQEAAPRKPAHTVSLCGANYVKPRTAQPPRPRPSPPQENAPAINGRTTSTMSHPTPPPQPTPSGQPKPVHANPDGNAIGQALQITRESLAALQKMQEQTAQLHRQFLDGQEHAHRTVHLLVEQQQRLLQASLGLPVTPLPTVPTPMPTPAPAVVAPPSPVVPPTPIPVPAPIAPVPVKATPAPAPVPSPVLPQQPIKAGSSHVAGVLLEVIAEKTGYPSEMLDLGMSLDADLGIDSIKRVEILSALQERLPEAPTVKPEHLGSLHTLSDIAAFLADTGSTAAAPTAHHANGSAERDGHAVAKVQGVLLEVIAEKTGYPSEMLELGMSLDADLGIDSIKRVEILSALQERLPEAPTVKPEHLGSLHTLSDIAAFLAETSIPHSPPPAPDPTPRRTPVPASAPLPALERTIVRPVSLPPIAGATISLPAGVEVWITDDDPVLAGALAERLTARGLRPRMLPCAELARGQRSAAPAGLVILAPTDTLTDAWLRDALLAVKHAGPGLRKAGGVLLTVSRLDGAFGLGGNAPLREPLDGGLAGLAKTTSHECPEVHCKAIDLSDSLDPEVAADRIEAEVFISGPIEVGLSPTGRSTLERVPEVLKDTGRTRNVPFHPGEVVVVSGGARGVTAEAAVALARHFQPTLVLLGRSPEPGPEPDWLGGLSDELAIKRELGRRSPGTSPRVLGEQTKAVLAAREIRVTLERVRSAGARVLYRSVDLRDAAAVAGVIEAVRREHGPVRGLVHGAGVLADAKIEDKTPEQFDSVYGTKVGGLRSLLSAVGNDELRALVLFSSSTARFGRAGQVDYAIANEVLNKLAWQESARRPNCRVVSLNWGPWDGGMVTPSLKSLFTREGIGVIPLEAGAELLVEELRLGASGPREVVVLAAGSTMSTPSRTPAQATGPMLPATLPLAFERVLELVDFPILKAHVLDGRPVVPVVLTLEWLAHAALVQNPGYTFHGCDDLRVLAGVMLDGKTAPLLRVGASKAARRDGFFIATAELRSRREDGREVLHARAEIILTTTLAAAPSIREVPLLPAYPYDLDEVYRRRLLFHGPAMQCIEQITGCGEEGIAGVVRSAPAPSAWLRQPLRQHWLSDPLVIDGSFQLLVLWSQEQRGAASLPCHIRRYRQYRRAFPANGVRVTAAIDRASDLHALADIDYTDADGRLVARLEGYECVIDPALERAFQRNVPVPV